MEEDDCFLYDVSWADDAWTFEAKICGLESPEDDEDEACKEDDHQRSKQSDVEAGGLKKQIPKSWSIEEDAKVEELVAQSRSARPRWTLIASLLGTGRSGKQVRERWLNQLDPSITKRPWTMRDDHAIALGVTKTGYRWHSIKRKIMRIANSGSDIDEDSGVTTISRLRSLPDSTLIEAVASLHGHSPEVVAARPVAGSAASATSHNLSSDSAAQDATAKPNYQQMVEMSRQAAASAADTARFLFATPPISTVKTTHTNNRDDTDGYSGEKTTVLPLHRSRPPSVFSQRYHMLTREEKTREDVSAATIIT